MNTLKTALVVALVLSIVGCASQPIGTTVTFPTASVNVGAGIKMVNKKGQKIEIFDFGSKVSSPKIEKKF